MVEKGFNVGARGDWFELVIARELFVVCNVVSGPKSGKSSLGYVSAVFEWCSEQHTHGKQRVELFEPQLDPVKPTSE